MAENIITFRDIKKSKEEMRLFADLIKDYLVNRIVEVYGYETTIITEINMNEGEISIMPYGAHPREVQIVGHSLLISNKTKSTWH